MFSINVTKIIDPELGYDNCSIEYGEYTENQFIEDWKEEYAEEVEDIEATGHILLDDRIILNDEEVLELLDKLQKYKDIKGL